jgi:hypothetical protein
MPINSSFKTRCVLAYLLGGIAQLSGANVAMAAG